jgi:hypothetical protein
MSQSTTRVSAGVLLLAVVLLLGSTLSAQEWERFRAAYPYHIQAIALSAPDLLGGRTMIISEPPPSVTLEDIENLDPALRDATTKEHRLGVDGWVKDVVIRIPALEQGRLAGVVNRLQLRLFGTAYKAYVMGIPADATRPELAKLNLRVTSGDLKTWIFGHTRKEAWDVIFWMFGIGLVLLLAAWGFIKAKRAGMAVLVFAIAVGMMIGASGLLTVGMAALLCGLGGVALLRKSKAVAGGALATISLCVLVFVGVRWHAEHRSPDTLFSPLLGGKALSCSSILENHRDGVFVSTKPGLVLWSFSKTAPLDKQGIEIREFALECEWAVVASPLSSIAEISHTFRPWSGLPLLVPFVESPHALQAAAIPCRADALILRAFHPVPQHPHFDCADRCRDSSEPEP